jgi:hypothetical protein
VHLIARDRDIDDGDLLGNSCFYLLPGRQFAEAVHHTVSNLDARRYAQPGGVFLDSEPMISLDYSALERWTRVGFERGMRFRKGER